MFLHFKVTVGLSEEDCQSAMLASCLVMVCEERGGERRGRAALVQQVCHLGSVLQQLEETRNWDTR